MNTTIETPAIEIHDTAFVTATFRASDGELSKDMFSAYWKTPNAENWYNKYVERVCLKEPFLHCLRNRFFYECLPEYDLVGHEDCVSLSKTYAPEKAILDSNSVLNENMYILYKK